METRKEREREQMHTRTHTHTNAQRENRGNGDRKREEAANEAKGKAAWGAQRYKRDKEGVCRSRLLPNLLFFFLAAFVSHPRSYLAVVPSLPLSLPPSPLPIAYLLAYSAQNDKEKKT